MGSDSRRRQIEAEIESLRFTIGKLEAATVPVAPDVSLGRLTRMEALASKGVNEAALEDARKKLSGLETALEQVAAGSYGVCTVCGGPIGAARLDFLPEATACVKCA